LNDEIAAACFTLEFAPASADMAESPATLEMVKAIGFLPLDNHF
jgi:hypothetical protein